MVRRTSIVLGLVALGLATTTAVVTPPAQASPRAATGAGVAEVTTGSAHHPWLGAWRVAIGHGGPVVNAYCIRTGGWFPGSPAWRVPDLAAPRGAGVAERFAMSYLLWRHGDTTDPVTAAGLNVALYSLSADEMAPGVRYPPPTHMHISHPGVAASAARLYDEGLRRRGPWTVQVAAAPRPGDPSRIRTTAHVAGPGGPIPGATAFVTITNGPGSGGYATDAAGNIVIDVTPHDPARPVRIDVGFAAPGAYQTLHDVEVPRRQVVVYGTGTALTGSASASVPAGAVTITKRNTNPAWQDDAGARFELRTGGADGALARTVAGEPAVVVTDAAGSAPSLRMAPGRYWVVETQAPTGQSVGFEPEEITVVPGRTVALEVENPADATAELVITKVDAETGEALAGGRFVVERDHHDTWEFAPVPIGAGGDTHHREGHGGDGDGADEDRRDTSAGADPEVGVVLSADEPVAVGGLLAGRYRVTEVEAPPGYTLPEVREVVVEVGVGGSTTVDFSDVRPAVTTEVSTPEALVGEEIVDTVVVSNVATWNRGELRADLYGPFEPDEEMACDDAHRVASEAWEVVGPGAFESPPFSVDEPGIYTFVGTWSSLEPGDSSSAIHECGLAHETVLVRGPMMLEAVKFNAEGDLPDELLATFELAAEADTTTEGHVLVARDVTDARGEMHVEVWSHARYCFEEVEAPEGFVLDPELRCTDGLLTPANAEPVELAEHPIPTEVAAEAAASAPASFERPHLPGLPKTGTELARLVSAAVAVSAAGGALLGSTRPRRSRFPR